MLELKDKAPALGVADLGGAIADSEVAAKLPKAAQDAVLALVGLGYARPQAAAAVARERSRRRRRTRRRPRSSGAGLKELAQ